MERVGKCYPVYERGYRALLAPIRNELCSIEGLSVIGRYGSFKYNNQDHSILMGLLAADNLLGRGAHDLWEDNTDYAAYQESGPPDPSGAVPIAGSAEIRDAVSSTPVASQ